MAYAAPRSMPPAIRVMSSSTVKTLIAGVVIALAVSYLVVMGLQGSTVYFLTVAELQAKGSSPSNQVVRVSGTLVPGTLNRDSSGVGIQFQMADPDSAPLPVVYRGGQVPDILGDDIQVVAEGKLDARGAFQASTILAKCPSKLESSGTVERSYDLPSAPSVEF
jgi:cytochrome c-type biogenesis protein CcmE